MSKDTLVKGGVIAAAVLLVGAYVVWWMGRNSGPNTADSIVLIDVVGGTVYRMPLPERGMVLPVKNPEGERRLLPVEGETGSAVVPSRYLGTIERELINPEFVNPETGEILVPVDKPVRLSR